jgi:hypothetical protein
MFTKAPSVGTPEDAAVAITKIVNKLDGKGGLWVNGLSPNLKAPNTATPEEVGAEYFRSVSEDAGPYTSCEFTLCQQVVIDGTTYIAAHFNTNFGQRILIIKFQGVIGWWTKSFRGRDWS